MFAIRLLWSLGKLSLIGLIAYAISVLVFGRANFLLTIPWIVGLALIVSMDPRRFVSERFVRGDVLHLQWSALAERYALDLGIPPVPVYVHEGESPYGGLAHRDRITVMLGPDTALSPNQLRHLIAHEVAHHLEFARKPTILRYLRLPTSVATFVAIMTLPWYWPLLGLVGILAAGVPVFLWHDRQVEHRCDAIALELTGPAAAHSYYGGGIHEDSPRNLMREAPTAQERALALIQESFRKRIWWDALRTEEINLPGWDVWTGMAAEAVDAAQRKTDGFEWRRRADSNR